MPGIFFQQGKILVGKSSYLWRNRMVAIPELFDGAMLHNGEDFPCLWAIRAFLASFAMGEFSSF